MDAAHNHGNDYWHEDRKEVMIPMKRWQTSFRHFAESIPS